MKTNTYLLLAGVLLCMAAPVIAQPPAPTPPPEEKGAEMELEEARKALAEAARRLAEISVVEADRAVRNIDVRRVVVPPVRIGVTIADGDVHKDGVIIERVSDEGPAAKAGLRAGDVLLAIDGKSLAATDTGREPVVRRIHAAIEGKKANDVVSVRYRRDGVNRETTLALAAAEAPTAFIYGFGDGPRSMMTLPGAPELQERAFAELAMLRPLGGYEFVRVSKDLGAYFNTDRGLLVVRTGESNPMSLKDGDVILSIDGREPESPTHIARILRSYQPGEKYKVEVMRQRRKLTIEVTVPERPVRGW